MRPARWLVAGLAVSVFEVGAACSSFTAGTVDTADAEAGAPPSSGDRADGSAGVDASGAVADEAGVGSGTNLVENGGFEVSTGACDGWSTTGGAMLSEVGSSHSGGAACRVCGGDQGAFEIFQRLQAIVTEGQTFEASAWVEPGGTGKDATGLELDVTVYDPTGGTPEQQVVPIAPPEATWTHYHVDLTVPTGGTVLEVAVRAKNDGSGCFLVDDVSVMQTN